MPPQGKRLRPIAPTGDTRVNPRAAFFGGPPGRARDVMQALCIVSEELSRTTFNITPSEIAVLSSAEGRDARAPALWHRADVGASVARAADREARPRRVDEERAAMTRWVVFASMVGVLWAGGPLLAPDRTATPPRSPRSSTRLCTYLTWPGLCGDPRGALRACQGLYSRGSELV
jgi:hypothetical protein